MPKKSDPVELASAAPASLNTLSPRADDPPALRELSDDLAGYGAALMPTELAWLRQMPFACAVGDYKAAIRARRAGNAAKVAIPLSRPLAAPPVPVITYPADSGVVAKVGAPVSVEAKPTAEKRKKSR